MADGAPILHPKDAKMARIAAPERNIVAELHGEVGDVAAGFAHADMIYEGTFSSSASACAPGNPRRHRWMDGDGVLTMRTLLPGAVPGARCPRQPVRIGPEPRAGGWRARRWGLRAKQEMLTEDIVALAVLKTGAR